MRLHRVLLSCSSALALALALSLPPAAEAKVGTTAAARNDPRGTPPQQSERLLRVGVDVFANERVVTGAADQAQLMFEDGSALTVGPNSALVLDTYVYDPARGEGRMVLDATKGVFRLVGGRLTKTGDAEFRVRGATIGIRGGIVIVNAPEGGPITASFLFGREMRVTAAGETQIATRAGSSITIMPGGPPAPPVLLPRGALDSTVALLEGGGSALGHGVAGSGPIVISPAISGSTIETRLGSTDVPPQNSGKPPTQIAGSPSYIPPGGVVGAIDDISGGTVENNPPPPRTGNGDDGNGNPPPVDAALQGRMIGQNPFTSFNPSTLAATRDPARNTAIDTIAVSGTNATITLQSGATVTVPWIEGQSASFDSNNSSSSLGPIAGGGFVAPDSSYFFYYFLAENGSEVFTVTGGKPTARANFPTSGAGLHAPVDLNGIPFASPGAALSAATANAAPSAIHSRYAPTLSAAQRQASAERAVALQTTFGISGQGAAQTSYLGTYLGTYAANEESGDVYLSGRYNASYREDATGDPVRLVANYATADTGTGEAVFGPNGEYMVMVPDSVGDNDGGTVREPGAGLQQPFDGSSGTPYYGVVQAIGGTNVPGGTRTAATLYGYTAGIVEQRDPSGAISHAQLSSAADPQQGVMMVFDPATNRMKAAFLVDDGSTGAHLQFGSTSGEHGSTSAFIDDNVFAASGSKANPSTYSSDGHAVDNRTFLVSSGLADSSAILPQGVSFCDCQYLRWGYWAGELAYDEGSKAGMRERVHLATWLAGTMRSPAEMPTTGSATFTGHAIGSVVNGNAKYVAVGGYSGSWNFGQRAGSVAITNFDGVNYSGGASATAANPRDFSGTISGGGRSGSINGSFFGSAGNPAAEQGGKFSINGSGYQASGTFAGRRNPP